MNGRVQDPVIGRFLSPDPVVQAPYDSRSLNRYSYVWNNPLTLVDPSGFQTGVRCTDNGYCGDICQLNPGGPECEGGDPCANYSDAFSQCMSIDRYQELEQWWERTQYLLESAREGIGGELAEIDARLDRFSNKLAAATSMPQPVVNYLAGVGDLLLDVNPLTMASGNAADFRHVTGVGSNVDENSRAYTWGIATGIMATLGAGRWAPAAAEAGPVPRVRHHTSPEALASIQEQGVINPSRGGGVHVETEPFGPARTASQETGAFGRGAYVEFDSPLDVVPTNVGPRNTGVIPSTSPLPLEGTNPAFVTRPWWKFWGD